MLYIIDFSERVMKWKSLADSPLCIAHEDLPITMTLKAADVVFAHSTHFCPHLTDDQYSKSPLVAEALLECFDHDQGRAARGLANVLRLRAALRAAGKTTDAPRLVLYSGGDLKNKAARVIEEIQKVSLEGFPKGNIHPEPTIIPHNINVQSLKRFVASAVTLRQSGTSAPSAAAASERLWTIYLLCDAHQLNEGYAEKVHDGTRLRAPTSPEQWFRPLGKSPCDKAAREIAAEVPTPEAAAAVEAFLKKVAKSRPTASEVQTTMTALGAALRNPSTR